MTAVDQSLPDYATGDTPAHIEGQPLQCVAETSEGGCLWTEFTGGASVGAEPGAKEPNSQQSVGDPITGYEGWQRCGVASPPNRVAVGIAGAATTAEDSLETRVGAFALVCAPRSCTSWSDNWPHLFVRDEFTGYAFNGQPLIDDVLHLIGTYNARFHRWLFDNFEERTVDGDPQIRPPSATRPRSSSALSGRAIPPGTSPGLAPSARMPRSRAWARTAGPTVSDVDRPPRHRDHEA